MIGGSAGGQRGSATRRLLRRLRTGLAPPLGGARPRSGRRALRGSRPGDDRCPAGRQQDHRDRGGTDRGLPRSEVLQHPREPHATHPAHDHPDHRHHPGDGGRRSPHRGGHPGAAGVPRGGSRGGTQRPVRRRLSQLRAAAPQGPSDWAKGPSTPCLWPGRWRRDCPTTVCTRSPRPWARRSLPATAPWPTPKPRVTSSSPWWVGCRSGGSPAWAKPART